MTGYVVLGGLLKKQKTKNKKEQIKQTLKKTNINMNSCGSFLGLRDFLEGGVCLFIVCFWFWEILGCLRYTQIRL